MGFKDLPNSRNCSSTKEQKTASMDAAKEITPKIPNSQKTKNK